jgi:hypothetical protein
MNKSNAHDPTSERSREDSSENWGYLGVLWQRCPEASATQLSSAGEDLAVLCVCESGVALRLPPQSKIAEDFWIALAEMPGGIGDTAFVLGGDLEVLCVCESGVALRLPPHSKIAQDSWIALAEMPGGIGDTAFRARVETWKSCARAKAVSRSACHRSPK